MARRKVVVEPYDPNRGAAYYVAKSIAARHDWYDVSRRRPPLRVHSPEHTYSRSSCQGGRYRSEEDNAIPTTYPALSVNDGSGGAVRYVCTPMNANAATPSTPSALIRSHQNLRFISSIPVEKCYESSGRTVDSPCHEAASVDEYGRRDVFHVAVRFIAADCYAQRREHA